MTGRRRFEDLVAEAESADVAGWDFSWLDGRAAEDRPSWGYARLAGKRLAGVSTAVDIGTGGGEVLAAMPVMPPRMAATESWPPNVAVAARRLRPRGVAVIADDGQPRLPFRPDVFDLVISRHPVETWWSEIARVLRPGGAFLSQQVGSGTVRELREFITGAQPPVTQPPVTQPPVTRPGAGGGNRRTPERARQAAEAAGLAVTDLRAESLRAEFYDIGAVVYFLRKVIWNVPDFTVARYRDRLAALHERILADGVFVSYAKRFLIEARKPA
jgi:SAM-dependent methyltransferase